MLACYTMKASGLSVTVNRHTGRLDYLDVDGKPMLEDGYQVTPNFWRAPTDNDYGAQLQHKFGVWKNPEMRLRSVQLTVEEVTPAPAVDSKNKPAQVIHYRIPAVCGVRLSDGINTLLQTRVPIYQLGIVAAYPIYKTK